MNKIHLAINSHSLTNSIEDYSQRLGCAPCVVVADQYALWRTTSINLSVRQDLNNEAGKVRHLGWEDPQAPHFSQQPDVNGIVWEHFSAAQQADEINEIWPGTNYQP